MSGFGIFSISSPATLREVLVLLADTRCLTESHVCAYVYNEDLPTVCGQLAHDIIYIERLLRNHILNVFWKR